MIMSNHKTEWGTQALSMMEVSRETQDGMYLSSDLELAGDS
jgi:hypothetical protein